MSQLGVVRDPGRPRRVSKTIKQVGAPQARSRSGRFRASCGVGDRSPHMTMIPSCHARQRLPTLPAIRASVPRLGLTHMPMRVFGVQRASKLASLLEATNRFESSPDSVGDLWERRN